MTKAQLREQVLLLPLEDQLDLAEELFERASPPPRYLRSDELLSLLESRRQEALDRPEEGIPWEVVRSQLRERG